MLIFPLALGGESGGEVKAATKLIGEAASHSELLDIGKGIVKAVPGDATKAIGKADDTGTIAKSGSGAGSTISSAPPKQKEMVESAGCFIAGTVVLTESGFVPIEEVKLGDEVYAADTQTGEVGLKAVAQTFVHDVNVLVRLIVDGEEIVTTLEHPFYVDGVGWVDAAELAVGAEVLLYSGETAVVEAVSIEYLDELVRVYNFEATDWHTYFVGSGSVLVHNNPCGTKPEDVVEKVNTNLGNEIDITPTATHSTTITNPGLKGTPNSSIDILDAHGNILTRRWFDSNGNQVLDVDFPNHGNPKMHPEWPHEHSAR